MATEPEQAVPTVGEPMAGEPAPKPKRARNSGRSTTARIRQVEVVRLQQLPEKLTWTQIANRVGYASKSGAYKAYTAGMRRAVDLPLAELRATELQRMQMLRDLVGQALVDWEPAGLDEDGEPVFLMKTNLSAVDRELAISMRIGKLLGVDAPVLSKVETSGPGGTPITHQIIARLPEMTDDELNTAATKLSGELTAGAAAREGGAGAEV